MTLGPSLYRDLLPVTLDFLRLPSKASGSGSAFQCHQFPLLLVGVVTGHLTWESRVLWSQALDREQVSLHSSIWCRTTDSTSMNRRLAGFLQEWPMLGHLPVCMTADSTSVNRRMDGFLQEWPMLGHLPVCRTTDSISVNRRMAGSLQEWPMLGHLPVCRTTDSTGVNRRMAGFLQEWPMLGHLPVCRTTDSTSVNRRMAGSLQEWPMLGHLQLSWHPLLPLTTSTHQSSPHTTWMLTISYFM